MEYNTCPGPQDFGCVLRCGDILYLMPRSHVPPGGVRCISGVTRRRMSSGELTGTHLRMQLLSKRFCNYTDNRGSVKIEKCFVDR